MVKHGSNWKGGKVLASNGYVLVWVGKKHHLADVRGYTYEHRLVAEDKLGRRLMAGEIPHHINGNRQDNRPENIEVMKSIAHHLNKHRKHGSKRKLADEQNPIRQCACGCGKWFNRFDKGGRPRDFISGHNPQNRECQDQFVDAVGERSTLSEIQARTGQSLMAVKVMAPKLVQQNKIARLGKGIYGRNH